MGVVELCLGKNSKEVGRGENRLRARREGVMGVEERAWRRVTLHVGITQIITTASTTDIIIHNAIFNKSATSTVIIKAKIIF